MPNKTEYYSRMAEDAARQVTKSREQWTAFLTTAARLYKYPYPDQLMIFTQRPDAIACAEYDLWNNRMNRYVKRGAKGIALVDNSGEYPRLRYVFDVSDTGERRNSRPVNLWTMQLDQEVPILQHLELVYGIPHNSTYLEDQLWVIADRMTRDYWSNNKNTICDIVEDSYLADYDELNIEAAFHRATQVSICYQLFSRIFGNPDDFFDPDDFGAVMDFNTPAAANVLGTAVSEMASQIFLEMERAVRNYERNKQAERSQENGRDNERNDLHTGRGLSDSGYTVGDAGNETTRQVRENEESVSSGEQHNPVQSSDSDREVVSASLGDSGDSDSTNRTDDDRTSDAKSGTGQENQSDGMGSAHEHAESTGRGDRSSGTYNQLNLFSIFPSEEEQIKNIDRQVETPVRTAESVKPSAFSISDNEIDKVLRRGSGFAGGKIRIYAMYQQQGDAKARADFLKNEYGTGGHSYTFDDGSHGFVDYDAKGLFIRSYGHDKEVRLKWSEVDKRLGAIIERGDYLTNQELVQYQQIEADFAGDVPMPSPAHKFPPQASIVEEKPVQMSEMETADDFRVGDTITLDGKDFIIESVGMFDVHLRDPESVFPIFRAESKENLERILGKEKIDPREQLTSQLEQFLKDVNPYEYQDQLEIGETSEDFVDVIRRQLDNPESISFMMEEIQSYLDEGNLDAEEVIQAQNLREALHELVSDETSAQVGRKLEQEENSVQVEPNLEIQDDTSTIYQDIPAQNFRIVDDHLGEGSPKEKFRANMDAIHTLQTLEAEDRNATLEEQQILSKYVGWGGLADAFDDRKSAWSSEYQELKAALSDEEYAAARASTLNAHYTSPTVIRAIYDAVEQMGFEHGNVLEPSMGVGNFFGMMPEDMQKSSRLYGVELDSITGRIAKKLYPEADITVAGFETTDRRDFYDLAVGNVPFGNYRVADKPYDKLGFSIHNYFFAKTLDQVRAGGVVAFVTSRYTMDSKNADARRYMAQRADFLGAIRLPNNAFRANAGTDVVSDIIFLQKRNHPIDIDPDWVHLGQTPDGITLNSYFVDHPEMVLGELTTESTQYGKEECTVLPIEGADLAQQLQEAIQNIGGNYQALELIESDDLTKTGDTIPADPNVKNFSYTVVEDDVYFRENSIMRKAELSETATGRIKGMVELRTIVQELIDYQLQDYPDEAIAEKQRELNVAYDSFSAKYGLINARANAQAFSEDSSYYLLCSLENVDENGQLESKADMFTKRTIRPERTVTSVDTPAEALAISIGERGMVDMSFMAELLGTPGQYDEIIAELRGVIFKDPMTRNGPIENGWQTADEYLSGNVREKLKIARMTVTTHPELSINVKALEKAQPKDLDASEIDVRLGATWIDKSYIQQFMEETFEPPYYLRRNIEVKFAPMTAEWQITGKTTPSKNDVHAYMTYGTSRANAYRILEDTLNLRDIRIYDTIEDADGKQKRVLNKRETTLAQQKQQAIKDAFKDWVWRDPYRRDALTKQYNELFNSTRPREYDGSHIRFGGMNPEIKLREHQQNAIAHVLYGGNTLLAHEVGAGKTFEMAASAMEAKRLGLCQKSLFVVPNHLTLQWANEFLRLYPSAKLLVASKKDFETANRKKFCARIATGDYDAVIIGHSQFERIPVSAERQERILNDQIEEIENAIAEMKYQRGENFSIKQMEKTRKSLQSRLEKLKATERKDDVITFEQLGVDRLFVDEAHSYKNLFLYTKMRNVAGLSTSEAQKSSDMFMKCQYMDELTGGRGIVFATGTPVSNSMTELYTMMRYLQYGTLKEKGLTHFDAWASTFGETTTAIELAPEGTGYRARTRFAKFFNLPELMNMFKEVADIKTSDQLHLPVPDVMNETRVVEPSEHQQAMVADLSERAARVHSGVVDPSVDNMLKITSDGRKLGLDQRLMNPMLPDDPDSKVNACVNNVLRIWEEGKEDKLTQLLFCDMSTPKNDGTFNVYDDIKGKLIAAGVSETEIAFIHDADTEARKKELFSKVRTGQVRVLLGSTAKMGAGTNVQDRLIAVHHLDVGWRPSDMTQRNGRIIRQGNRNKEVQIYQYVTNGTFDAYLYQTLENKQKFISQIMTSKSPVRSCDDVDEQALSYAEIKALCAGDPNIREKMDLDVEVARLKVLKADHQSQQYRLEDQLLKFFPAEIEKTKGFIKGFKEDMEVVQANPVPEEGFVGMEVKGVHYTEKADAGEAILAACKGFQSMDSVPIGSYRGFQMELSFDSFSKEFQVALKGEMTHRVSIGTSAVGNMTRLDNVLAGITQKLEKAEQKLEGLYQQQENAKAEVGKSFPQEAELAEKSARLSELDALLNMDERDSEAMLGEDEEKPSVLADLKNRSEHTPPARGSSEEVMR